MNKSLTSIKVTTLLAAAGLSIASQGAPLEEIVVTAQKREQSLQDVPISIEVLTGDILKTTKIDSAEDLALSTPSINFQKGFAPSATTLGIRGLTTFNQECCLSPSVSMVIDGVPVQRASEFLNRLGDVERIEILRGPQGTLFGRNATAGAINLVRKKPTEHFEGQVEVTVTDDDETTVRGMVSGPLSENVRARLVGYHSKLDDYVDNFHPVTSDIGGEESYGVLGKLDIDITDDVNLLLTAEYTEQNIDLSSSVTTIVSGTPGVPSALGPAGATFGNLRLRALGNGDPALGAAIVDDTFDINENQKARADSENWGVTADLSWRLGNNLTLKSITAFRDFDFGSNPDVDASPADPQNTWSMPIVGVPQTDRSPAPRGYLSFYDTGYFTEELRLEGSSEGVDWVVGGFYQHFEEDSLNEAGLMVVDYFFEPDIPAPFRPFYSDGIDGNNYYFTLPAVDSHAEFDSYAVFGDVTFQVTESVEVFAGLRWSWQDMDLDFLRNDWVGPAGSWNGVTLSPSPFFDNSNPDFVLVDGEALLANPLYAGFQSTTAFTREDRSEDWSGRIGASWDINPDLNLYASASRGFVAAGANVGRVTFRDNAILEPSVSEAYELGFKSTLLEGAMRLNGALFWQETTDLQTTRLIPGQVTTEAFNAGTLTAQGVELDLTWAATNNLRFTGSMTYLDTEMSDLIQPCYPGQTPAQGCTIDNDGNGLPDSQDLDGEDSPNAPELSYRVNARYDLPLREMPFDAYFMVTYTWKDDTQFRFNQDPFTVQEAYGVTDMFIGITDREGRYEMQIFGKNVFDEDYVAGKDSSEPTIGRVFSRIGRFEPYYGMKLTYNF